MALEDYFLDEEKLENGCRMQLSDMQGNSTEDWLSVLYIHSDEAQALIAKEYRDRINTEGMSVDQIAEQVKDRASIEMSIRHLLVKSWSFEQECTPENVKELLRRNPEIANRVFIRSENKRFFLPEPAESSLSGQDESSNSAERPPEKANAA